MSSRITSALENLVFDEGYKSYLNSLGENKDVLIMFYKNMEGGNSGR